MFYKVEYEYNGNKDCLYFRGATTKEQREERITKMKKSGFTIIDQYPVGKMQ